MEINFDYIEPGGPQVRRQTRTVLLLSAILPLLFIPDVNATGVQFSPVTYYGTGTNPLAVVVSDFNRDGKVDIATANAKPDWVSVLLGKGDGTFLPHTNFATAYYPLALTVGDLNNDLNPDIVIRGQTNISVLLGNGAGNFTSVILTNAVYGSSICLADLNKDGKLDLASSSGNVAFGNGNGTFRTVTNYSGAEGPGDAVSAAEMNGDGSMDLIFAGYYSFTGSFSILTNAGNGTFGSAIRYGPNNSGSSLVVADFDANGRADVATVMFGSILVRTNAGNLNFGTTNTVSLDGTSGGGASLTESDFDFDGKTDLLMRSQTGTLKFVSGKGDGTFRTNTTLAFQFGYSSNPRTVAAADFNKDGRSDVVFLATNAVGILLNTTPPDLQITTVEGHVQVTWYSLGYTLETSSNLASTGGWQSFPFPPVVLSNRNFVADHVVGNKFYRLRK